MKHLNNDHRLCVECREHRAIFRFRGRLRRDKKHNLCFQCFRSQQDSLRSARLTEIEA